MQFPGNRNIYLNVFDDFYLLQLLVFFAEYTMVYCDYQYYMNFGTYWI